MILSLSMNLLNISVLSSDNSLLKERYLPEHIPYLQPQSYPNGITPLADKSISESLKNFIIYLT